VISKKEGSAKIEEKEEQGKQVEPTPENGNKAKAGAKEEEFFDPETADREDLLAKIRTLEEQLGQAEERVLRTAAEAENFKKRLQREKEEQTRYANEAFMRELLPVVDNLERALQHAAAIPNQEGLLEGLNMTLKGFIDTLAKFGCIPVEAVGKEFDPNFHEAVSQEANARVEPNTVLRELQKGYLL
jgi:molecular chaperone GrpE